MQSLLNLVNQITPGIAYLVNGNVQQVYAVCLELNLSYTVVEYPTVHQIRDCLQHQNPWSTEPHAFIFIVSKLNASNKKGAGLESLPTEEEFKIASNLYCFILSNTVYTEDKEESLKQYKKLQGGCYNILDLKNINFRESALLSERTSNTSDEILQILEEYEEEHCYSLYNKLRQNLNSSEFILQYRGISKDRELSEILSYLGTTKGVCIWSNLSKKFIVENFTELGGLEPYITKYLIGYPPNWWGYGKDLVPYLIPFLEKIKRMPVESNYILGEFALWVFYCNKIAKTQDKQGFQSNRGKKKNQLYFSFNPSKKGQERWLEVINSL